MHAHSDAHSDAHSCTCMWSSAGVPVEGIPAVSGIGTVKYQFVVKTRPNVNAGTDADVEFTMYGSKGVAAPLTFYGLVPNRFEMDACNDDLEDKAADVGDLKYLDVKLVSISFGCSCFRKESCLRL